MFKKIKDYFSKKPINPWVKKIAAVRGEVNPGHILLDIATYEGDALVPMETTQVELPIHDKIRPTVNRILAGQGTPADHDVLETYAASKI